MRFIRKLLWLTLIGGLIASILMLTFGVPVPTVKTERVIFIKGISSK